MPTNGGEARVSGALQSTTIYPNSHWQQQQWQQPFYYWPPAPAQEYANDVEVTEGEHDVTLRFYRKSTGSSRTVVKEITLPRSLYESLFVKAAKRR